jgi:hypothetical protein
MACAWMAGLTAVVFLEKAWRSGQAFGYAGGGAMILAGLLFPGLPRCRPPSSAETPRPRRIRRHGDWPAGPAGS